MNYAVLLSFSYFVYLQNVCHAAWASDEHQAAHKRLLRGVYTAVINAMKKEGQKGLFSCGEQPQRRVNVDRGQTSEVQMLRNLTMR